jgi:hypothetical protein
MATVELRATSTRTSASTSAERSATCDIGSALAIIVALTITIISVDRINRIDRSA